jgi:hypothetical protein
MFFLQGIMMKHTIDYTQVWNDAMALVKSHREALIAIAGLLLFLPSWISQFFAGNPDFSKAKNMAEALTIQQAHLNENWMVLLPTGLIALFGSAAVMVLLGRKDLERVGDALPLALWLVPVFLILQFAATILLLGSVFVFLLPGLYVLARLWPVSAILSASPGTGFIGSLSKSWELTKGAGWKALGLALIILFICLVVMIVVQITIGVILKIAISGTALLFLETAFSALAGSLVNVVFLAVSVALFRHLDAQPV